MEKTGSGHVAEIVKDFVFSPFKDFVSMYETILSELKGARGVFLLVAGLAAGWWLYVPIHELMHALGCLATGGGVSELRIQPLYGGRLLSHVFSFVVPGGDYAGRLVGFDTKGSDFTYAATVYFPFLLSLPGFYFMDAATRKKSPFLFAFAIPLALAPLISLTGDFFELGSLGVFQVWPGMEDAHRVLISDDVFRLFREIEAQVWNGPSKPLLFGFVILSFFVGLLLCWCTLYMSDRINHLIRREAFQTT